MVLTFRTSRIIIPLPLAVKPTVPKPTAPKDKEAAAETEVPAAKPRRVRQDWDPVESSTMGTICHRTLSATYSLVWLHSAYLFPCCVVWRYTLASTCYQRERQRAFEVQEGRRRRFGEVNVTGYFCALIRQPLLFSFILFVELNIA